MTEQVRLPEPKVGDPFPTGAADDENCPHGACQREPEHPGRHVHARGGIITAVW